MITRENNTLYFGKTAQNKTERQMQTMDHGNVLVIGNSGVGKSTLINAVLGENRAETGWGTSGTTKKLSIYESDVVPFRVIDTIGFEPSVIKEHQAINAVKKWSKRSAKEGCTDTKINVIWFCVDGTARKLFEKNITDLSRATAMWKSVPIIVVITKSYSVPERESNIEMVHNAFAKQSRYSKNLRKVIPVVASTYTLNDSAFAPPEGITELIDITNELMPEGVRAAANDLASFKNGRKRAFTQSVIAVSITTGAVIGAVPIPIADALILSPIELAEVNAIAGIYGINKDEEAKRLFNSIVEVGTVGVAAKAAISALKAIPGVNLAAGVLNAIIAGSIIAALGEGSAYVFEQIYLGNKTTADIDWVKKILEAKFSTRLIDVATSITAKASDGVNIKEIGKIILEAFANNKE